MNDRRHTAVHEAGHAVIGRALTLKCGLATIVANFDEGEAGHAIIADFYATQDEWEAREKFRSLSLVRTGRILACMAGAEAEIEILGECHGGDGDDQYWIRLMLHDSVPEGKQALREHRLRRMARMLVRRHRADIERVAAALEGHETLSGEEIDAMLAPGFMARPVTWALAIGVADRDGKAPTIQRPGAAALVAGDE